MAYTIGGACDGCTSCLRQCPTAAITGAEGQLHKVDPRRCIDCGVCGQICPVDAVFDPSGQLAQRVPRDQRLRPVFDLQRCNGCNLCTEFCAFACLGLVGTRYLGAVILAEPLQCVSCGDCATVCIKGAVHMRPLDLRTWSPQAAHERALAAIAEVDRDRVTLS